MAMKQNNKDFKGYTLEEIRYRKMVNTLKIDLLKQKIHTTVKPEEERAENAVASVVGSFQMAMQWFDMAMLAVGVGKKLYRTFRRKSK